MVATTTRDMITRDWKQRQLKKFSPLLTVQWKIGVKLKDRQPLILPTLTRLMAVLVQTKDSFSSMQMDPGLYSASPAQVHQEPQ